MATLGTFAAFSSRAFSGSGQFSLASVKFPTGGNYIIDDDGYGNRVHVFTSSGTFTIPTDVITNLPVNLKVLAVGGGGDAGGLSYYNTNSTINDDNAGGGGGGGSVVYANGFTSAKGMSFAVTVGAAGGSSIFEGLHPALGGGDGGTATNFSRGEPGGRGGGGSWQNGRPSGPRASANVPFSNRHPGYKYGTSGTAAPANYIQISTPALGPDYTSAPSCTIPITYADSLHGVGNHQYRSVSPTPDSSVPGAANNSSPYGESFRSRGGGGTNWTGGWGGLGVRTNFFENQHDGTTYRWICAGGHGKPGYQYSTIGTYPNAYVWRDAGHSDTGTQLNEGFVAASTPASDKFLSAYQDQYSESYLNAGYDNYGSGGGFNNGPISSDGQPGIIRIAYKLADYPGGAPAATANIFGGTITTSTDGAWRYHTWVSAANKVATSINSQGWYISSDYTPYQFETSFFNGAGQWAKRSNPYDGGSGYVGAGVANTSPFYYYGDIPYVADFFKYFIVGGGGARGRGASGTDSEALSDYQEYHYGGGGSGGIDLGSFGRDQRSTIVTTVETLQDDMRNNKSDGSTTRYYSDYFDFRPGYIEVRANSMLNEKIPAYSFEYVDMSLGKSPNRDHRERNGRIRLAAIVKNGKLNNDASEGNGQPVNFLRCVASHDLDNGVWQSNTDGSNGTNSDRGWLVFYARAGTPSNPATYYIDPVVRLGNYDSYFYENYFKVVLHGIGQLGSYDNMQGDTDKEVFQQYMPSTGTASRWRLNFQKGTWTGPDIFSPGNVAVRTISGAQKSSYFVQNQVTGVNPGSNESYYNMIVVDQRLCRWQNGDTKWSNFVSNVVDRYGNGSHPGGTTNNYEVRVPAMVKGLGNVDPNHERTVSGINATTVNGAISGGNIGIQYVLQQGNDTSTRRFETRGISTSESISVPAGWKIVGGQETKNNDAHIYTGITDCLTDGNNNPVRQGSVKLFVWLLRKIIIRRIFVHDIQVGRGGGSGRIAPWRYRSGAPSTIHRMSEDKPTERFAGGGGAGGHRGYTSAQGAEGSAIPDTPVGDYHAGQSQSLSSNLFDGGLDSTRWGSAGGGAWRQKSQGDQSTTYSSQASASYGSDSQGVESYAGGGTGGGSLNTLSQNGFVFYGAPRGSEFSQGRRNNRTDLPTVDGNQDLNIQGKGGGGFFSGQLTNNWTYDVKSITCGPSTYYYSLYMDAYPHNASFSAGGGGGINHGSYGYGGTGGNGAAGFTSSITGVALPYGAGGGGFGRFINGVPGSSLPPNPSDQTAPVGAPVGAPLAPAFLSYGTGGGWSAGKQEGGGADGGATKYYPGSGPWPASYSVGAGEAHMDAMRFWYTPSPSMPSPQKGDVGRPYGGKQGVVIVSYSKGQFIYPV